MNIARWLVILMGAGCALLYFSFVIYNSQNIPFADDLSLLNSLYDIRTAQSTSGEWAALLAYHNEHRLLGPRIVALALARLNGGVIDFRHWVWFGNVLLLPLLLLFYRVFASYRKPLLYFLPVVLLLFQPVFAELTYWGMAALQNIGVLALSALTVWWVSRPGGSSIRLLSLFGLGVLTALTGANGLLLLITVVGLLLLQRRYVAAGLWGLATGLVFYLYWQGFIPGVHSGTAANASPTLSGSALSMLGLLGSLIESQRFEYISVGLGMAFFGILAYVGLYQIYGMLTAPTSSSDHRTLFLLGYVGFLLLTMAAIAVNRHLDAALHVSRYKIYPVLLLICLYLVLFQFNFLIPLAYSPNSPAHTIV